MGNIDTQRHAGQAVHVLREGFPVNLHRHPHGLQRNRFGTGQGQHGPVGILRPQWGKTKPAIPNGDGGHTVPTADRAVRVPVQLGIIVGVQIDESRSNDLPAGINLFFGVAAADFPNLSNLTVLDTKVGLVTRHLRPVDDRTVLNHCIELRHTTLLC